MNRNLFRACRSVAAAAAIAALLSADASAQLSKYTQDFESLDRNNIGALAADGWKGFATGFNPDNSVSFGVGIGVSNDINNPRNTVISETTGGDPPAGQQGLVVLSDYESALHNDPNDDRDLLISIFQEQIIGADDIGKVARFTFLADGNLAPPTGEATAEAFLLTLDPMFFFATNNLAFDTTTIADGSLTQGEITLDLSDPALEGQILQFGFRNRSSDFEGSAVDYDNVRFRVAPEPSSLLLLGLGLLAGACRRR